MFAIDNDMLIASGGGIGFATVRSIATTTGGQSVTGINKPAGIQVGDIVLVLSADLPGGSAGNDIRSNTIWPNKTGVLPGGSNSEAVLFQRVMTALDLADVWTLTNTGGEYVAIALIPHGATGSAIRSTQANADGQSSLTLTGFQPTGYGAVILHCDRDADATPAVPTGFTSRFAGNILGAYSFLVADYIDYNGGDVMIAPTTGASDFAETAFFVELT